MTPLEGREKDKDKLVKKYSKTLEEYKQKIDRTREELVSKQAWLGRLLKKTVKLTFYGKSKPLHLENIDFICLENLT